MNSRGMSSLVTKAAQRAAVNGRGRTVPRSPLRGVMLYALAERSSKGMQACAEHRSVEAV